MADFKGFGPKQFKKIQKRKKRQKPILPADITDQPLIKESEVQDLPEKVTTGGLGFMSLNVAELKNLSATAADQLLNPSDRSLINDPLHEEKLIDAKMATELSTGLGVASSASLLAFSLLSTYQEFINNKKFFQNFPNNCCH